MKSTGMKPEDSTAVKRYVESAEVEKFLTSAKGFSFLIDKGKTYEFASKKTVDDQIASILDFYMTWAEECPIKKGYFSDGYTIIKLIEKHCDKKDVLDKFTFLF